MKKIFTIMIICSCCLFAACNEGASTGMSSDDLLKMGNWGENQEVSVSEQDNGKVLIVNQNGDEVLDVTKYAGTDILADEFTGEPRLIKTYTFAGKKEVTVETDITEKIDTYTMDYYDTFGHLLIGSSARNLVSVWGSYGLDLSVDWEYPTQIIYLPTGEVLPEFYEAYLTDNGIALMTGDCIFYDGSFHELHTEKNAMICGFPQDYVSTSIENSNWWGYYSFSSLKDSDGKISCLYNGNYGENTENQEDINIREITKIEDFYNLIEKKRSDPQKKGSLLIFRSNDAFDNDDQYGLIDDSGNVVIEDKYRGFAFCGKDMIVAFGADKTDLYASSDFSLVKSIPLCMVYYDGTNSVVQVGDYSYYLADADGNSLAELCNGVFLFDMEAEGQVFTLNLPNSEDVAVVDREGNLLFQLPFEPGLTYIKDNVIAVHAKSGYYMIDTTGSITKIIRLFGGYVYDEAKNEIIYKGK